ncbi:MAG: hypothetical protein LBL79_01880 [Prevotella sp.]|jgi:hypothetical protein|nr:hypothetical protein [Prevotella sp.]
MIKSKGIIHVNNGNADKTELMDSVHELEDGEYGYLLFDKEPNKALPQLKYLFGIVLKRISDALPEHPSTGALYSYFEEIYAPVRTDIIAGEKYEYFDLKTEKSIEVNDIIEKIIRHAETEWGIKEIPARDELKAPEARELYAGAYASQWENYSRKI